jgi:hypothetical protein
MARPVTRGCHTSTQGIETEKVETGSGNIILSSRAHVDGSLDGPGQHDRPPECPGWLLATLRLSYPKPSVQLRCSFAQPQDKAPSADHAPRPGYLSCIIPWAVNSYLVRPMTIDTMVQQVGARQVLARHQQACRLLAFRLVVRRSGVEKPKGPGISTPMFIFGSMVIRLGSGIRSSSSEYSCGPAHTTG